MYAPKIKGGITMYRIPIYKVQLVRDSSVSATTKSIKSPKDAHEILSVYMSGLDRENFVVAMVDTKNKIIGINTVSVGNLDSAPVHPREVFKPAILSNAAGIFLAHNHPSGDTTPSEPDVNITKRLVEAGNILGIKVLDHLIISNDRYTSLLEIGRM
jgi:DNA repair protein RadC